MSPRRVRPARLGALSLLAVVSALLLACAGAAEEDALTAIAGETPFESGERLHYTLIDTDGQLAGIGVLTATLEDDAWRFEQSYVEADPPEGAQPTSDEALALVDTGTFEPRYMERSIQRRDELLRYIGEYADDASTVTRIVIEDGERSERTIDLREHAYENESSLWLWRTLPLSEDYAARYVSMNVVDAAQQTISLRVTQRESIEVPAGEFDTWRLEVRSGRATHVAWIEVEAPHRVIQWDSGALFFRLTPPEDAEASS